MPAEFVVLTTERPGPREIARAVASTDPTLAWRMQRDGQHLVLRAGDSIIVTLVHPRQLQVPSEVARLLPTGVLVDDSMAWWTSAVVPFGQEARAEIVLAALAAMLDGHLYCPASL